MRRKRQDYGAFGRNPPGVISGGPSDNQDGYNQRPPVNTFQNAQQVGIPPVPRSFNNFQNTQQPQFPQSQFFVSFPLRNLRYLYTSYVIESYPLTVIMFLLWIYSLLKPFKILFVVQLVVEEISPTSKHLKTILVSKPTKPQSITTLPECLCLSLNASTTPRDTSAATSTSTTSSSTPIRSWRPDPSSILATSMLSRQNFKFKLRRDSILLLKLLLAMMILLRKFISTEILPAKSKFMEGKSYRYYVKIR